jgi:hypothetical protein
MKEEPPGVQRLLSIFLLTITAIVVVFLAQLVLHIESEVGEIKTMLARLRTESVTRVAAEPFKALETSCLDCHSDRKFLGVHGSSFELKQIISRMEALPDAHISAKDRDKIHASLLLLRCARCHDGDNLLRQFATLETGRQRQLVREMAEKPGSTVSPEETEEILRAYRHIQGF